MASKKDGRDLLRDAPILFAWELGSGLGHATKMRPLVEHLNTIGCQTKCLAVRRDDATKVLPCMVEQAPVLKPLAAEPPPVRPYVGHLADTLANCGWDRPGHLLQLVRMWQRRLARNRPGVLVMDCAPTALLAAQGMHTKTVWLADQWGTPPAGSALVDMRARHRGAEREVPDTEPAVVASINGCLARMKRPPIRWLGDLFERVDHYSMLAIPEVDPHAPRPGVSYTGMWGAVPGSKPVWPATGASGQKPCVFAYLKPFPFRGMILRELANHGLRVLAYVPNPTEAELRIAQAETVRVETTPVAWQEAASEIAFTVCSGTNMIAQSLQNGLPVLAIPLSLEQFTVVKQAKKSEAVIPIRLDDMRSVESGIQRLLNDQTVCEAALRLKNKYEGFDPENAAHHLAKQIAGLVRS